MRRSMVFSLLRALGESACMRSVFGSPKYRGLSTSPRSGRDDRRFWCGRVLLAAAFVAMAASVQAQQPSPFGANVFVLDPKQPAEAMQAQIDKVYAEVQHSEFSKSRYAFLLMPGEYKLNIPIGFYTQVLGLGATPDAVHVSGDVHVDAAARNDNATTTFWRSAEGFSATPPSGTMQWAVSQAIAFRRMHVLGDMVLNQKHGWASGGWMADTAVDGTVNSGTQQQWISRNTEWKGWAGSNWNMVFVGVKNAPEGEWPKPVYTKFATTPVLREKPFLVSDRGQYSVVVPSLVHDASGVSWRGGRTAGRSVPLKAFYIAHAGTDTAATINAALAKGKHLLLTPGIYELSEPIRVTRKDTVVYGLGFATLHPVTGTAAMTVADVDGVTVSGLLFDAGPGLSPALLEVGPSSSQAKGAVRHVADPISLHDVFFRVGGAGVGKAAANLVINSNNVIVDHTWIWRADHGSGVGWADNVSANGLIVNGNDVTIYGLFVEHHQQYQVLWNGERGRTYFFQSEIPYDPPTQGDWSGPEMRNGWASYKVGSSVKQHEAWGLGVYSVFRRPDVVLTRAFEVPETPGVRFHHMITVALGNHGEITHVINDTGEATALGPKRVEPKLAEFPAR